MGEVAAEADPDPDRQWKGENAALESKDEF